MSNFKEQSFPMPVHQNNCRISGFCKKAWVRRLCCFIPVFFSSVISFSQQQEIDSLLKVLPTLKDTARINCMHQLSLQYFDKQDKDSTLYYLNLVYEELKKLH